MHLDEVGHLAADVGFGLCPAVGRRHDDAPFGSGGSFALVTDRGRVQCDDKTTMGRFRSEPVVNFAHIKK